MGSRLGIDSGLKPAHGIRDYGIHEPFLNSNRFRGRAIFYIFLEQFIEIGPVRIFFVGIIFWHSKPLY